MKNSCYLAVIVLFFSSCVSPRQYHQRINYIPTKGSNFGVEVLSENQVPEKPYFEVIDFEFSEKGKLSKLQAKKKLEMEAIKEGLDAVIMLDHWNEYEEKVNALTILVDVLDEDGETTVMNMPYTYIKGIGLKYLENIENLNDYPEFEYVYKIDSEEDLPEPFFKVEYNLTGQEHRIYPESDEAQEIYDRYFQFYSDYHLIHQRESWYYTKRNGQLKKRVLIRQGGLVAKTCKFTYDEQGRMSQIDVNHHGHSNATVNYHYDELGTKLSKSVVLENGARLFEQYTYVDGKLDGRKIKIIDPGKINMLLNSMILYFDADYLKDFYEEAYSSDPELSKSK